jgi:hypothetical protein
MSGATAERGELRKLLASVREGDVVVVTRLRKREAFWPCQFSLFSAGIGPAQCVVRIYA